MCLITFAYKKHPKYELILAGNRDEFYERPARPARFWEEEGHQSILAGKDLEAGGTWLGAHKDGRWGALTNYRDPTIVRNDPPSRGELVLNYLNSNNTAIEYLQDLSTSAQDYNGFNLLLWDSEHFYHFSNQSKRMKIIEPGIHGLSNALLDTPWPKLNKANEKLESLITSEEINKEDLFDLLLDESKADDDELPVTGIPRDLEKAISSIFIKTENYGTRCSTLLLIDKNGKVDFTERTYKPGSISIEAENHFSF